MEQSYKEKYEDILARLERAKNDNEVCDERFCCVIDDLIPELAESEDEKMRKELIKHLKELSDWKEDEVIPVKNPSYYRQWASWLEKQGQVKESAISQHENRTCEENCNSLTYEDEKVRKEIINYFRCQSEEEPTRKEIHDKWIAWIERQGEKDAITFNNAHIIDSALNDYCCKQYDALHKENGGVLSFARLQHLAMDIYGWCKEYLQCEQKFEMKTAEESLGIDSDTYNKIVDECIFGEQKSADKVEPKFKVGEKELTNEELCEGLIRGMVNEHNRVTKEVLRNEYEKGRDDMLAKIDAIDVDEMVCESGATSRVTQYWYAHGVNDVIKKLKEEQV